jgi:hypothetical protein
MGENYIEDGIGLLKRKWPQSHAVAGEHGYQLITVPGVLLPEGYRERICTLLFVAPPGMPGAFPQNFFTDIEVRLTDGRVPIYTNMNNANWLMWPQWRKSMWWNWKPQTWSPNRDSLATYLYMCLNRIRLER